MAWNNILKLLYLGLENGVICTWDLKPDVEDANEENDLNKKTSFNDDDN